MQTGADRTDLQYGYSVRCTVCDIVRITITVGRSFGCASTVYYISTISRHPDVPRKCPRVIRYKVTLSLAERNNRYHRLLHAAEEIRGIDAVGVRTDASV